MKTMIRLVVVTLVCMLTCSKTLHASVKSHMTVDNIIFSMDRPMQLWACLESSEKYVTGIHKVHVLYRSSSKAYEEAYRVVRARFPKVHFHRQGPDPAKDFKPLLLTIVHLLPKTSQYIMFTVDDIIMTGKVDVTKCTKAMEKYRAWGFFLRLGLHIRRAYFFPDEKTPRPHGRRVGSGRRMFLWTFKDGRRDWRCCNSVDNVIYRKNDILESLKKEEYVSPNYLEASWLKSKYRDLSRLGICYNRAKNINLPMNNVSGAFENKCEHSFSPAQLLEKFQQGFKIDISKFHNVRNSCPHVIYRPRFIKREKVSTVLHKRSK